MPLLNNHIVTKFVRQGRTPVQFASVQVLQANMAALAQLRAAQWEEAGSLESLMPRHDWAQSGASPLYDAYLFNGDWENDTWRQHVYAGCACYVVEVPADARMGDPCAINSVTANVFGDRWLQDGAMFYLRRTDDPRPLSNFDDILALPDAVGPLMAVNRDNNGTDPHDTAVFTPGGGQPNYPARYIQIYVLLKNYLHFFGAWAEGSATLDARSIAVDYSRNIRPGDGRGQETDGNDVPERVKEDLKLDPDVDTTPNRPHPNPPPPWQPGDTPLPDPNPELSDRDWIASRPDAFNWLSFDWMEYAWKGAHSDIAPPEQYCPHWDLDEDGWDNWSECRRRTNPRVTTPPPGDPIPERPHPVLNVTLWIASNTRNGKLVIHAYSHPEMDGVPDAVYTAELPQHAWPAPLLLRLATPDSPLHNLRQGGNYFFAFLDTNGNGQWEDGKPAGLAEQNTRSAAGGSEGGFMDLEETGTWTDIPGKGNGLSPANIGWHENRLDFCLTDMRMGFPRWRFQDGPVLNCTGTVVTIERIGVNEKYLYEIFIKAPRNHIHEGDILRAVAEQATYKTGHGLDWGYVGSESALMGFYLLSAYCWPFSQPYLTNSPILPYPKYFLTPDNLINIHEIIMGYPRWVTDALKPTSVYPVAGSIFDRSEMEFRWVSPWCATCFELVIRKGTDIVYASGVLPVPVRCDNRFQIKNDATTPGEFRFVNCAFSPCFGANVLAPGVEYKWQIYVFTPTVSNSSGLPGTQHGMRKNGTINYAHKTDPQPFRVTPRLGMHAGTFNIDLDLAYFTPDGEARDVHVEAFDNAAFAGSPVARTVCQIDATRPAKGSATLKGLDSLRGHYVRAFVRADSADGIKPCQPYDPMGYVCAPERDGVLYEPLRITDTRPAPTYRIPIYGTDINNNRVADANEISSVINLG